MRYDWRHILSWSEVLCFVLVWSLGIGSALMQLYGSDQDALAADVASSDAAPGLPAVD